MKRILLTISLFSGWIAAEAQCTFEIGSYHQDSIECNGGYAGFNIDLPNGTPPYSYDFDGNTGTINGDTMIWAQSVIDFSSEYGSTPGDWSASDVIGAPNVYPNYSDDGNAWTSADLTNRDFIVVSYPPTVSTNVYVYETYEPGSTDTVYVHEVSSGNWITIYTGTAVSYNGSGPAEIKNYPIPGNIGAIDAVRLAIDGGASTYYEIDAIGIQAPNVTYSLSMPEVYAGTYNLNITDNNGCTFDTTLVFNEPALIEYTQNLTICSNQSVNVGGNTYNSTGNYTDYLTNNNGCDSIVYTNLTVNSGNATYLDTTITLCMGGSFAIGNSTYTMSGNYSDTLANVQGCDSVITSHVTIYSTNTPMVDIIEAGTVDITFGGTASCSDYYSGNPAADAFNGDTANTGWGSSGNGYPSWLEYDYGAGNEKVVKGYAFICGSAMVGGWGYSGYDPGAWELQGSNGANWTTLDSRVDYNSVQDVWYRFTVNNNIPYSKYRVFITDDNGGGYAMITELKFFAADECANKLLVAIPNEVSDTVTSYAWMVNGNMTPSTTDSLPLPMFHYGDTITCVITTNNSCATSNNGSGMVVMNTGTPMAGAMANQTTITAMPPGLSYQWLDCDNNNAAIAGETNQTFTATVNGNYSVEVSNGNCPADTSNCVAITTVGIESNGNLSDFNVYPNPNNGSFSVNTSEGDLFTIYNNVGQVVKTIDTRANNSTNVEIKLDVVGVYYLIGKETNTKVKIVVTK